MTSPVVFVHGIIGSELKNEYPVDFQKSFVWGPPSPFRMGFDAAQLHAANLAIDRSHDVWVGVHQVIPLAYESMIDAIRGEHTEYAYVYRYDWRKDNRLAAEGLKQFIHQVLTKVNVHVRAKNPRAAEVRSVTLVGHSMGGLVIKWYATRLKPAERNRIDKIITIATPYFGSLKALEMLTAGARFFFGLVEFKGARHAARTMPGVYQLLPAWEGALKSSQSGESLKVFKTRNWQTNVKENLAREFGAGFLGARLRDAAAFHHVMAEPYPRSLNQRVFTAYGHGTETMKEVRVQKDHENLVNFRDAEFDDDGDGTVHRESSKHPQLDLSENQLLEEGKSPRWDFPYGHHSSLLRHPRVQDWLLGALGSNRYSDFGFNSR